MSENSNKNLLSELREKEAEHLLNIRRYPRYSSEDKSELEDLQQQIKAEEARQLVRSDDDECGEDGVVW